jgi:hypothetical protein
MRIAHFALCLALSAACDPMTHSTREDLAADALKLFEGKIVVKDPASNLCLVILRGELGRRPVLETHLVRCKSEAHLHDPVRE